jgi:hypothetical protein
MAKDNQHFNPQGLLRGFTIRGEKSLLWEYDKETGEVSRHPKSTRNVCSQYQFYAQRDTYGNRDTVTIEDALQKIEDQAIRIIHNLCVSPRQQRIQLSAEEKGTLSLFISILWGRVPSLRDSAVSFDQQRLNEIFRKVARDQYEADSMPAIIKEMYESDMLESSMVLQVDVQHIMQSTIGLACQHYMRIFEKHWTFCVPESGMSFVTSDNPVCFSLPPQCQATTNFLTALYHPQSEIFVALRRDLAVRCAPTIPTSNTPRLFIDGRVWRLGTRETKSANKAIAHAAHRYVYSGEKSDAFARMVGKLKGTEQRYRPETVAPGIPLELSYEFRNTEANED